VRTRVGILGAAGLALLLAGCGGGSKSAKEAGATSSAPKLSTEAGAAGLETQYEQVVRAVLPSIVQIETDLGEGSGVVYDGSGDIVTNAHVVAGAKSFKVTPSSGGKARDGSLAGAFNADDLAVVKADPSGMRPARFGDSSKLQVGQIVMAMGNPLGLSGSVTQGIVSALGRTVTTKREGAFAGATIANSIQTSAAINPGNSGGALVTLGGDVIGIPSSAASDPQMGGAAVGIGFAIPSTTVKSIVPQLIKNGKVTNSGRAALGVTVRTVVNPQTGAPSGVGIVSVTAGGAAAKAGLQPGDVITGVNGTDTPAQADLAEALANLPVGQTVSVDYTRDGKKQSAQVTLGELPSS
jgi:putative serine protease PepD